MKILSLFFLFNLFSIIVPGQTLDTTGSKSDTTRFSTPNPIVLNVNNYETFNSSFITGNSQAVVRSGDNPRIFVDGIPMNPWTSYNTHYAEFLGCMNILSYDLQQAEVTTLQSDDRIVYGSYNNAISFKTHEIKFGRPAPEFAVNNFTTMAFQDFDTLGLSNVISFSGRQSFKKAGYRFSVNNGYQNDYIPKNGLQRYGGNVKFKYQPIGEVTLTGFVDYTGFRGLRREDNLLKSDRLLSYLNADIVISKALTLYGKYSLNNVADSSERYLQYNGTDYYGEPYSVSLHNKNHYRYRSSYFDVGFALSETVLEKIRLDLDLGYNQLNINYVKERETLEQAGQGSSFDASYVKATPGEKVIYTSLRLSNKVLSIKYLFNLTNTDFSTTPIKEFENKSMTNQLISVRYDPVRNDNRILNRLGFQADYARLINYTMLMLVPDADNDNLQFAMYSSLLKNRMNFTFSVYQKNYNRFMKPFSSMTGFNWVQDIGKLKKSGYTVNGNVHILKTGKTDWLLDLGYTRNTSRLELHKNLPVVLSDTVIHNRILLMTNNFRYRNLHLNFTVEGKTGYDIALYGGNITVAEPYSNRDRFLVTGISNEAIPTIIEIENPLEYIPDTDYFILRQIELGYEFRDSKNNNYSIGLQYNKMRRIYLYVNDINLYKGQFQTPSFFSALSLSFRMTL